MAESPTALRAGPGEEREFRVELELREGYEFRAAFPGTELGPLVLDEPPPLGAGRGPNAARLVAAAVAHCLSASALYCLRRARVGVRGLRAEVRATLVRNERGRWRLGPLTVTLRPELDAADRDRLDRCLELFEDFCVVTQSVRAGLDVRVRVVSEDGAAADG
jgi:organic hydroperoxide reductase OsmC/OhrA